jgi:hypothetical protein
VTTPIRVSVRTVFFLLTFIALVNETPLAVGQQIGERQVRRLEVDLRCSNTSSDSDSSILELEPGWAIHSVTSIHKASAFGNYSGSVKEVASNSSFVSKEELQTAFDEAYNGMIKSGQEEKAAEMKSAQNSLRKSLVALYASHHTIVLNGRCKGEGALRGGGRYHAWVDVELVYMGEPGGFQLQKDNIVNGTKTEFRAAIVSPLSDMALDVPGGFKTQGLQTTLWPKNGTTGHIWRISTVIPGTSNPVKIKSDFTGLALTVAPGSTPDLQLVQATDQNLPSQLWDIVELPRSQPRVRKVRLVNQATGRAIDVPNSSKTPGVKMIAYPINHAKNQEWLIERH